MRNETKRNKAASVPTVPFEEVTRFSGLGRRAVVDMVRAGILKEAPGRSLRCEITTPDLSSAAGAV
jgi:hypothetical protein